MKAICYCKFNIKVEKDYEKLIQRILHSFCVLKTIKVSHNSEKNI